MNKIIEIALKEVGVTESPKNSNNSKYNKWFGLPSLPWCGMFVSWCYDQAGQRLPNIGFSKGFAGCQTAVAWAKKNKKIVNDPQPGDIVFFDWNADGRYDHTGIFVKWGELLDTFETVEGNTSYSNQSNGGSVMIRRRSNVKNKVIFVRI